MNEPGGIVFVAADVAEALIIFGISAPRSDVADGFISGNATEDGGFRALSFPRGLFSFYGMASRTRTQSSSPVLLFPGVEKPRDPELGNGEPAISRNLPLVGSYHRAFTGPESFDRSAVMVADFGQ